MKKRVGLLGVLVVLLLLLAAPVAFAGFWDWFDSITGFATFGNTSLSISVGNAPPFVANISFHDEVMSYLPNENTVLQLIAYVVVNDTDGTANLEGSASVAINMTFDGNDAYSLANTPRVNHSCTELSQDLGTQSKNYSCGIHITWFDPPAVTWNLTARVTDINGAQNDSGQSGSTLTGITIQQLQGLLVGPENLTWPQLAPGVFNQTPLQNITLNNTGNANFSGINVTAYDLRSQSDANYIPADNFSISGSQAFACLNNGTNGMTNRTINGTALEISNVTLPLGNYTVRDGSTGQEELFLCLRQVPSGLTSGVYTTPVDEVWILQGEPQ